MTAPTTTTEQPTEATQSEHEQPRYAHYVDKSKIVDASVFGTPLITLCGRKLIPGRDPGKFPVCPSCREELDKIHEFMQS